MVAIAALCQGVEPQLRESVWPILLQLHDVDDTRAQRSQQCTALSKSYANLLALAKVRKLPESIKPALRVC